MGWPGDLLWSAGLTVVLAFLAAARFRSAARPWVRLERPQRERPAGRGGRTNELDAGKRRPMIGAGKSLLVVGCWVERFAGVVPGCVWAGGVV
ncbi:MAG: hypothetical protein ACM3ML_00670 [Micromonosporaceae bacterium]